MQLYHGDCLDLLPKIPDGVVDLVLCDLPYGTTGCAWDTPIPFASLWSAYARLCRPGAPIVLFATQPFASALVMSNPRLFKHEWVWHKSKSGSAFTAKFRPMAKHELVLVFGRGRITYHPQMVPGTPYARTRSTKAINNHGLGLGRAPNTTINTGTRYPDSVIFFQQKWRRQDQVHPTQKPVALLEYLVRTYSDTGALVLDHTMGSGSTGVACRQTGRRFIGMESDAKFFATAERRMADAVPAIS